MSDVPYAIEGAVLPPRGGCTVRTGAEGTADEFQLLGGESVFAQAQIASGAGDRFALAGAKCERRLPARYGPAPEVPNGFGRRRVFPWRESGTDGFHPEHTEGYR